MVIAIGTRDPFDHLPPRCHVACQSGGLLFNVSSMENVTPLSAHPHYQFNSRCALCGREASVHETETPDRLKFAHCVACGFFKQWPYMEDRLVASAPYLDSLTIRRNDREFYCATSLNVISDVQVYLKTIAMGLLPGGRMELHATICNEPPNWSHEATFHRTTHTTYTLACLVGLVTRAGLCIQVLEENKGVVALTAIKQVVV